MKKSKVFGILLLILFFSILTIKLIFLNGVKHEYYEDLLKNKTQVYVNGTSAPRGRIIDCNGKVLVDNIGVNTIIYHKIKGITSGEEISIARTLASFLNTEVANESELKNFWLVLNNNGKNLITEEEYQLLEERKLTKDDLDRLKKERITEELLSSLDELDQKSAHIYALMNAGYNYQNKIIYQNPSPEEYALVLEKGIPGITGEMTWERVYNYNDTLKSILGSIGSISKEEKEEYLKKGYELSDIVGISYLEKEYEDYLKGTKALYRVNKDNTLNLVKEARRGNDLVLAIDIEIQMKVEEILKEKILAKKNYRNTEYYKDSYAIVGSPSTGEIIAMAGVRLNDDGTFSDITSNIINTSYTMGSAVKGATISVGYKNNLIEMGKYITDSCVKLHLVPYKCSHARLGRINDLDALAQSSNYYQYMIAINLVGKKYYKDMVLGATKEHFDIYRDTLKEYGLGTLTGIDLPNEEIGIIGSTIADDLLLNLAIGQYDTYTPIEMLQYINSIATGSRLKLSLMQSIVKDDQVIKKNSQEVLNKINLDPLYLERIRLGMQKVLQEGTGRGFTNQALNAVGKTGTSESFYDADNDGKVDVETITSTFVGYFPKDNPEYSVVVITPNISHKNGKDNTKYYGAYKITRAITDYLGNIN